MSQYTPTIGLEVHAELKTQTKMFCNSKNDPDEANPNVNVCPVCMAFPGTLPVVNHEAVKQVLRMGAAINGELADYTEFDRKNYFYPDLPKGYQISQFQYPLVKGGTLNDVSITRIHLEEDTARSQHGGEEGYSLVDFNRAGLPLMELVTEPCIHDATTASAFAQELQLLLRSLGAGDANMEKGQMRVEANISISKTDKLGTKVEVKNLNSFKAVEKAIAYELKRQEKVLEGGGVVVQETRGWDENKGETFSQRLKEDSHDYRYFPDPDIPKFRISRIPEFATESLKKSLPELPWEKRNRLISQGISAEYAEILLTEEKSSAFYKDELEPIADDAARKIAINLYVGEIRSKNPTDSELANLKGCFAPIADLVVKGSINSTQAKSILNDVLKNGGNIEDRIKSAGTQMSDTGALETLAEEIIAENPSIVAEVKGGKIEALKFLIGQGMKKSKGSANPAQLEKILTSKIAG